MDCLDVLGAVVSPSTSHPLGLDVVGHNFVVMCEGLVANGALPVLLDDLSVE